MLAMPTRWRRGRGQRQPMSDRSYVLALDTATRHPTLGLVGPDDDLVGERQWESLHRHGEQLLEELDQLLAAVRAHEHSDLRGVIVGVGPGSFTGLRIGLATAKTIAYSLNVPLVGVSTTHGAGSCGERRGGRPVNVCRHPAGRRDGPLRPSRDRGRRPNRRRGRGAAAGGAGSRVRRGHGRRPGRGRGP